jgi:hypothetical protein
MNRYIFLFLIAAFSLLLHAKCVAQKNIVYGAGITYTVGIPTFVPPGNSSRVAIDTVTSKWYEYATPGGWRWSGDRVQDISGCAVPAYVPTKGQSRLVLNSCTPAQNGSGPELYQYQGSVWVRLNAGSSYTAGTGIDITGTLISNTGDLSNTNELQTLSSGTNTVTLSNGGGTVTVDTDPTNDITSLSGGTGISVSGTGNSRTITNTGDLSATNELQTLSISGDTISLSDGGGSVVVPAGGVTWPLLAPTAEIPVSYSFEDYPQTGIFSLDGGLYINTLNGDGYSNLIAIYAGAGIADPGGPVEMGAGGSTENDGGYFLINAGSSNSGNGGGFDLNAGDSETGNGGNYNIRSGNGANGGNFTMNAGNGATGGAFTMSAGSGATGGAFTMSAGSANSNDATNAGNFEMYAGSHSGTDGTGGTFTLVSGSGEYAGFVSITAGTGVYNYGKIFLEGGGGPTANVRGAVEVNNRLMIVPMTITVRNNISDMEQGDTIMCSNCTATDGSTGVLQTYNGTTWKNHW